MEHIDIRVECCGMCPYATLAGQDTAILGDRGVICSDIKSPVGTLATAFKGISQQCRHKKVTDLQDVLGKGAAGPLA